ncbi:hypothetical protein ACWIDJ_06000 [Brevundimonas naejangsanensis]
MAPIQVTVRVVRPWWLPVVVYLAKQWFGWKAFCLDREGADAELAAFADWYGRQLRAVVD